MEIFFQTLAEKLFAEREKEAPVKPDYAGFMYEVFGHSAEPFDTAFNENAEFATAVEKTLSTLRGIDRYCTEERYLHGKSVRQLADEFRNILDMEKFAEKVMEDVYISIKNGFMENIEKIFDGMEDNSFRELEYLDGIHPRSLPKNDTYYDPRADKSVLDVLRDTLGRSDSMGFSYKDIFENCFIKGQTKEELAQWLSEHLEEYISERCLSSLRKLRMISVGNDLKKFLGCGHPTVPRFRCKDKCVKCIYNVTHYIGEEPEECSACKTAEVKAWLDGALSELSPKKKQVIKSLYDTDDGLSTCNYKKTAVKLGLESREYVMKLETSALKALRKKAVRELHR